jgi:hypothetical protein
MGQRIKRPAARRTDAGAAMTYTHTDDQLIVEADPTELAIAIAELRQEIAEARSQLAKLHLKVTNLEKILLTPREMLP